MRKSDLYSKSKGFTLLEVLTVVFLGTIIILAAYTVYLASYKAYQKNSASTELTQNGRIALERMSREIRQTNEILTELPENPETGAPANEIKFQDGHILFGEESACQTSYITYYRLETDLHRKVSHYSYPSSPDECVPWSTQDEEGNLPSEHTDLDQVKAEHITSLKFWGDQVVTMRLEVSDGENTYDFETKVLGRNIR